MVTDFHQSSAPSAPAHTLWFERSTAWLAASREVDPATELCGEIAEFMGMLGEDED